MGDLLDQFVTGFSQSPWRIVADVADVLVVAYLIYRLLLLVRGTRAMQIAVGLALVFVVHHLARRMMLVTLSTILDAMLGTIVVLVVVLFQNDIRRLLARVGARPFFRSAERRRDVHAVEEVVKAAGALAQKHVGALIVFERDASLEEFCQQGTVIDAEVSKEILYSMFVPSHENPLHDGAVVVRDGRVWQAGVFLPLTGSLKLDRSLGTRHRAAIGITEETDAVVVVVSEERGAISMCFNGNMARDLDAHSLRQALLGLFTSAPKRGASKAADATGRRSIPPTVPRPSSPSTVPVGAGPSSVGISVPGISVSSIAGAASSSRKSATPSMPQLAPLTPATPMPSVSMADVEDKLEEHEHKTVAREPLTSSESGEDEAPSDRSPVGDRA
jgi:diadenylate cyclase